MKLLEYSNCFYNLDYIESFKCLGAVENEIEIILITGKKLHFRHINVFPTDMDNLINFIKDPEATYFRLSYLDWRSF